MATWRWDAATASYVSSTGDVVTVAEQLALRDLIADNGADLARTLVARFLLGEITLEQWADEFAVLIGDLLRCGYFLGCGGKNAARQKDVKRIVELIQEQADFAKGFVRDLAGESLSEAQAKARAAQYADAAVRAYEEGNASAFNVNLPVYPGDGGTACGGKCRCHWDLEIDEDTITATWVTEQDKRVCAGCQGRANTYNPLVIDRKGEADG